MFAFSYSTPCSSSTEQPSLTAGKRAALSPPGIATVWTERREDFLHECLDMNGNFNVSSPVARDSWEETDAEPCQGESEMAFIDLKLRSELSQGKGNREKL